MDPQRVTFTQSLTTQYTHGPQRVTYTQYLHMHTAHNTHTDPNVSHILSTYICTHAHNTHTHMDPNVSHLLSTYTCTQHTTHTRTPNVSHLLSTYTCTQHTHTWTPMCHIYSVSDYTIHTRTPNVLHLLSTYTCTQHTHTHGPQCVTFTQSVTTQHTHGPPTCHIYSVSDYTPHTRTPNVSHLLSQWLHNTHMDPQRVTFMQSLTTQYTHGSPTCHIYSVSDYTPHTRTPTCHIYSQWLHNNTHSTSSYDSTASTYIFLTPEPTDEYLCRRRQPILYQQWGPSWTHKIFTDIRLVLPPFFVGGKMSQILAEISTPVALKPPYFWTGALYRKTKKNCQGLMIGLPSYQTWGGWVPPTPRTVGAMGTPKSKSGKFLIYPPFQWPTPSRRPPILHQQWAPLLLINYPHTFDPLCTPFLHGGQNVPNFGPNFDPNRLRTAVFLRSGNLSKIQNKLVKERW